MKNCIYKFTFPNGKVYIGQTVDYAHRLKIHKYTMNHHPMKNKYMYYDMQKYGWENITKEVLIHDIPKEHLDRLEGEMIDFYDSYNNGYNQTPGWIFNRQVRAIQQKLRDITIDTTDFKKLKLLALKYKVHITVFCDENKPYIRILGHNKYGGIADVYIPNYGKKVL